MLSSVHNQSAVHVMSLIPGHDGAPRQDGNTVPVMARPELVKIIGCQGTTIQPNVAPEQIRPLLTMNQSLNSLGSSIPLIWSSCKFTHLL